MSFVQSPEDAEYDSMPRAAIGTGAVDFVLPVAQIPARLVQLWANLQHIRLPKASDEGGDDADNAIDESTHATEITSPSERQVAERAVRQILATLRTRTHHDFRHYKRATVLRRIERRMQVNGVSDLPAYQRLSREPPRRVERAAAGHADQRDQFLPRRGGVRRARERSSSRSCSRRSRRASRSASGSPDARPARRPTRSRCCCASTPTTWPRVPAIQVFATDIDERAHRRSGARATTRRASSPTCRRPACGASSSRKASSTASRRRSARPCCSPRTTCCATRRSRG